jgi:TldD protein
MLTNDTIIDKYFKKKYKNISSSVTLYNLNREIQEFSYINNEYFTTSCYDSGYSIDVLSNNDCYTESNFEYGSKKENLNNFKSYKEKILWFVNEIEKIKGVIKVNYAKLNYIDKIKIMNSKEDIVQDFRICTVNRIDLFVKNKNSYKFLTYSVSDNLDNEYLRIKREINQFLFNDININNLDYSEYPILFDKGTFGVVIHESVGHMLESDLSSSYLHEYFGKKITLNEISVFDSAKKEMPIQMKYDDEGNLYSDTTLINKGKLIGHLSSNRYRSHNILNQANARRQCYRNISMPRMSNTYIANGIKTKENIINNMENGILIKNCYCGSVNPQTGDINIMVNLAYLIKNGIIQSSLNNLIAYGNGMEILGNINQIGNDLTFNVGLCIKKGQKIIISTGSPTVLLNNIKLKELI